MSKVGATRKAQKQQTFESMLRAFFEKCIATLSKNTNDRTGTLKKGHPLGFSNILLVAKNVADSISLQLYCT